MSTLPPRLLVARIRMCERQVEGLLDALSDPLGRDGFGQPKDPADFVAKAESLASSLRDIRLLRSLLEEVHMAREAAREVLS